MLDVPHDADDFTPDRLRVIWSATELERDPLADRVNIGKERADERLVDNRHEWGIRRVTVGEMPAPDQRDAHGFQKVRRARLK